MKTVAIAAVKLLAIAAVLIAALGIVSGFLRHQRQTVGAGGALVHVTYETARLLYSCREHKLEAIKMKQPTAQQILKILGVLYRQANGEDAWEALPDDDISSAIRAWAFGPAGRKYLAERGVVVYLDGADCLVIKTTDDSVKAMLADAVLHHVA